MESDNLVFLLLRVWSGLERKTQMYFIGLRFFSYLGRSLRKKYWSEKRTLRFSTTKNAENDDTRFRFSTASKNDSKTMTLFFDRTAPLFNPLQIRNVRFDQTDSNIVSGPSRDLRPNPLIWSQNLSTSDKK